MKQVISPVTMVWNEANETVAKREALSGQYVIADDGQPQTKPTQEERIAELEEALALLLSGVTE